MKIRLDPAQASKGYDMVVYSLESLLQLINSGVEIDQIFFPTDWLNSKDFSRLELLKVMHASGTLPTELTVNFDTPRRERIVEWLQDIGYVSDDHLVFRPQEG